MRSSVRTFVAFVTFFAFVAFELSSITNSNTAHYARRSSQYATQVLTIENCAFFIATVSQRSELLFFFKPHLDTAKVMLTQATNSYISWSIKRSVLTRSKRGNMNTITTGSSITARRWGNASRQECDPYRIEVGLNKLLGAVVISK